MKKSKVFLGLKKPSEFSLEDRKKIIEEWLNSGKSKQEIWSKHTGMPQESGYILNWMRELGMVKPKELSKLDVVNTDVMAKSKKEISIELLQTQDKIKQLEKALVESELRATVLDTMIEVAEKELKISIRKKSNTKQSIR